MGKEKKLSFEFTKGIIWGFVLCALMSVCGCKTQYVAVEKVRTDTLYKSKLMHDSIHIHDSVSVYMQGDTRYHDRWRTEYIYKLERDTLLDIRRDSIPFPYPVEKRISVTPSWVWYILLYAVAATILIMWFAKRKR